MTFSFARLPVALIGGVSLLAAIGAGHAEGMKNHEHRSCARAGGEATMITRGLAEFMAKAALGHAIDHMDAKAAGPIEMVCNDPAPLTYCRARQRACK